jgi:hypothetical protein
MKKKRKKIIDVIKVIKWNVMLNELDSNHDRDLYTVREAYWQCTSIRVYKGSWYRTVSNIPRHSER